MPYSEDDNPCLIFFSVILRFSVEASLSNTILYFVLFAVLLFEVYILTESDKYDDVVVPCDATVVTLLTFD